MRPNVPQRGRATRSLLPSAVALAALGAGAVPPAGALQQDAVGAASPAVERQRAYLERNPFHGPVFDELLASLELEAVEGGALARFVRELEARCTAEPDAVAPRVLLARVVARQGDLERAHSVLTDLVARGASGAAKESDQSALQRLIAQLELEAGDFDAARARLQSVVDASPGAGRMTLFQRDGMEQTLEELAEAHDLAGDTSGLRATLDALGALVGADVAARIAVAERFERYGFTAEALDNLRLARDAAGTDAARRCDALAALGGLLERCRRGAEALAVYDEALTLLAPGHWLRVALFDRALTLRTSGGTLDAWLAVREADRAREPRTAALDIARALERSGRGVEATQLLAQLAGDAPRDRELAERLIAAARASERLDLALDALQRRADERQSGPDAIRAQLDLAEALTVAGAADGARLALSRAEASAVANEDTGALMTIAQRRAAANDLAGARATLESAATVAPTSIAALLELATLAEQQGDRAAYSAALDRAAARADGPALIDLAQRWLSSDDPGRAEGLLQRALELPSARRPALELLAQRAGERAEVERARALWWTLARESSGQVRARALDAVARSLDPSLLQAWLAEGTSSDEPLLRALVEGRVLTTADEHGRAAAALAQAASLDPRDLTLQADHARALTNAGRLSEALEVYAMLARAQPRQRAEHLLSCAKLQSELRRRDDAAATLRRTAALARNAPDVLRQVAARYQAIGDEREACNVLARVLRLDAGDTRTVRTLARLEVRLGRREPACARLAEAWERATDTQERAALLVELVHALGSGPERDTFLNTLVMRVREDRFDPAAVGLALELLPRTKRFHDLAALSAILLARDPDDPRGAAARLVSAVATGDRAYALSGIDARIARGDAPDDVIAGLLDALRAAQDLDLARELGARADDAAALARALRASPADVLHLQFLRGYVDAHGLEEDSVLTALGDSESALEPPEFALRVLLALEARDGTTIVRNHRVGKLYWTLGDRANCLARGARLFELDAPLRMIEGYFKSSQLEDEFEALRSDAASRPLDRDK
ncbi:MAG: hypothetical protein R3F49_16550 [Planctomycetota bacterium]